MKTIEEMNHSEFVDYLSDIIAESRNNNEKATKRLSSLKRVLSIIEKNPQVNIEQPYMLIKRGKRVSVFYDGTHYFLMPINSERPFEPSLDKNAILDLFNSIENDLEC